jgi:chemotaxis protein methyltransferase CheR
MNAGQEGELAHGAAGLAAADFDRLAAFIHRVTGIKMPRSKHSMVEGRLRRRMVATGSADFAEYCASVFTAPEGSEEIVNLIDAITTNKTDFFREPEHFRSLTETVLPEFETSHRPLKVWSAACSIGAEPYTLAMVLSEYRQAQHTKFLSMPAPSIIATDLCTTALATARLGIYPTAMIEPVPAALRQRYILRDRDPKRGMVRIVPALRAMVRFGRHNLMAPRYNLDRDFDVVFCRNVLIYFERKDQAAVLQRLCDHLRPGGLLVIGHSETVNGLDLPVQPIAHTMFRRE